MSKNQADALFAELDEETRGMLARFGFDAGRFLSLRERVISGELSHHGNIVRGHVEPPGAEELTRLPEPDEPAWHDARRFGVDAIRRGEVAMAVLNGGMATRFGSVVKGVVEAVDGRSFLEWKLLAAQQAAQACGGDVPCVVMNSFATDAPTRAFLDALGERGAELPRPLFFTQLISLRLNRDGSIFRGADGRPSLYGPGHGDFPEALRVSGTLAELQRRGVRMLLLSNVDNLGARVDPLVVGMHLRGGRPVTSEIAAKWPGDAGGSPARVDGRTIVVESFRFPAEFEQERIRVFNVNSFVFDLEALAADQALTYLYVEKQVDGRPTVQLERLVNELTALLPTTYLEVPRTGPRGRFIPVKEPEDLAQAQSALREMLYAPVV